MKKMVVVYCLIVSHYCFGSARDGVEGQRLQEFRLLPYYAKRVVIAAAVGYAMDYKEGQDSYKFTMLVPVAYSLWMLDRVLSYRNCEYAYQSYPSRK